MTTSPAEHLLSVQLEQAGIPFEREYLFAKRMKRKWRADFLIHGLDHMTHLLVEIDGATWSLGRHNRPSSIAKEFEKGAAAAILGFRVIHCTTEQVNDGTCFTWIQQALGMERDAA